LRVITNDFAELNEWPLLPLYRVLFDLSYQGRMPVDKAPKRQAWTAQQKWFAVELKRKFPDKKLDDIIIAVKAKFDRDVSSSTLCAWLKPETAKIEQLANASGQNTKRRRICDYPKLEHALFLWYRGHETRGAAVTGDADSEGQGACVDP
jgi:hypothetical protein